MGRIADYLAESLTEKELNLLWNFIQTGGSDDGSQTLVNLRLAEPVHGQNVLELTSLGKEVYSRSTAKSNGNRDAH